MSAPPPIDPAAVRALMSHYGRQRRRIELTCARCGQRFAATRTAGGQPADAPRYCSARCRVAAHRARQREQTAQEPHAAP